MATTDRDLAKLERDLITVTRRYKAREKQLEEAASERDRVIRDAIEMKLPRHKIVGAAELSPQRIDQIRRNARL